MSYDYGYVYDLALCSTCDGLCLIRHNYHDFFDSDEMEYEVLYPMNSKIPLGLPDNIKKSYRSSLKVKNIDANAFGVLVGRTLELVCVDRDAKGKFLGQKLQDLSDRNEIPKTIVDVANNLKDLRNIAAHSSLGELTEEEVPVLDDLCRAILEYVYSTPYLVQHAKTRLEKIRES